MPHPNLLSEGRRALIARLGGIIQADDYRTGAGSNVQSGWFAEVIKANRVSYPLIVVQKGKDQTPKPGPGALLKYAGFNVIGAVNAGLDGYEDALDDLELDILECLMTCEGLRPEWAPPGVSKIVLGEPQQVPPGDGISAASVVVPVYLHTVIHGRETR